MAEPLERADRWDRGAWVTICLVAGMLFWSLASVVYLFTLPTDGWQAKTPDGASATGLIYVQNLLGAPSSLQPGDHVQAVAGIPLAQNDLHALAGAWQPGQAVTYTVQRAGTQLTLRVPVVRWTPGGALRLVYLQAGGWINILEQLAFLLITALVFWRRPADHAARTLFLLAAAFIALSTPTDLYRNSVATAVNRLATLNSLVSITVMYTLLLPPLLLRLGMVFPRPKPALVARPWLEYLPLMVGAVVVVLFWLTNGVAGFIWSAFAVVAALLILVHSAFTMRDALSRAQLQWGLWGMIVGFGMLSLTFLPAFGLATGALADFFNTLATLSFGVIGVTLAIAITRYHLWDIDILIRRTLVYSILSVILILIYLAGVTLSQRIFTLVSGQRSPLAVVISTLLIAAVFTPLRRWIQAQIDRRFNRQQYDSQKTVEAFLATARRETDLESLAGQLLKVTQATLEPESISLWIKKR